MKADKNICIMSTIKILREIFNIYETFLQTCNEKIYKNNCDLPNETLKSFYVIIKILFLEKYNYGGEYDLIKNILYKEKAIKRINIISHSISFEIETMNGIVYYFILNNLNLGHIVTTDRNLMQFLDFMENIREDFISTLNENYELHYLSDHFINYFGNHFLKNQKKFILDRLSKKNYSIEEKNKIVKFISFGIRFFENNNGHYYCGHLEDKLEVDINNLGQYKFSLDNCLIEYDKEEKKYYNIWKPRFENISENNHVIRLFKNFPSTNLKNIIADKFYLMKARKACSDLNLTKYNHYFNYVLDFSQKINFSVVLKFTIQKCQEKFIKYDIIIFGTNAEEMKNSLNNIDEFLNQLIELEQQIPNFDETFEENVDIYLRYKNNNGPIIDEEYVDSFMVDYYRVIFRNEKRKKTFDFFKEFSELRKKLFG